jgi:hypothetical protein
VFTGLHHQNYAVYATNDITQNVYFMLSGRSNLLETSGALTTAILSLLLESQLSLIFTKYMIELMVIVFHVAVTVFSGYISLAIRHLVRGYRFT